MDLEQRQAFEAAALQIIGGEATEACKCGRDLYVIAVVVVDMHELGCTRASPGRVEWRKVGIRPTDQWHIGDGAISGRSGVAVVVDGALQARIFIREPPVCIGLCVGVAVEGQEALGGVALHGQIRAGAGAGGCMRRGVQPQGLPAEVDVQLGDGCT